MNSPTGEYVTRRSPESPGRNDFFSTWVPWILLALTLLPFVGFVIWLVVTYVGVEFGAPPWDTRSVPPPRLY